MIDPHVEIILPLRFGHKMSLEVRKPAFCICKNKDPDQLCGNRDADQCLCFCYTDRTIFLLPKYKISSIQPSSAVVQPGLCHTWSETSDFIWQFLPPYMGVMPNPKMAFIFPISCIFALIFPLFIKYFPKCEGKGSFPKSQIKSLEIPETGFLRTRLK